MKISEFQLIREVHACIRQVDCVAESFEFP